MGFADCTIVSAARRVRIRERVLVRRKYIFIEMDDENVERLVYVGWNGWVKE